MKSPSRKGRSNRRTTKPAKKPRISRRTLDEEDKKQTTATISESPTRAVSVVDRRIVTPIDDSTPCRQSTDPPKDEEEQVVISADTVTKARRKLPFPVGHNKKNAENELKDDEGKKVVTKKNVMKARRKLSFPLGPHIDVDDNVRLTYKLVHKLTGSVGGNGSFGAIYGELTVGSMQKMVNLMKEHTGLDATSKFIDVGSGIGKPNLHVMQDPGVAFSYGIEMERSRWLLGMASLKAVLAEARKPKSDLKFAGMFDHGNIKQAKTFDPFTHVYMFSIGFPPSLWEHLSDMFNKSASQYLICFHSPKVIVERYDFQVELLVQTPTSMHGSKEGHTGYLYKRSTTQSQGAECDPLYRDSYTLVHEGGLDHIYKVVAVSVDAEINGGRVTRARKMVHCIESEEE